MIGTSPNSTQRDIFSPLLSDFIDLNHELVLLAQQMDWSYFEQQFAPLYSDTGQPAMPIRFMVGCLLLKRIYNYGDETLAQAWIMNPYMQYFCGEGHFQHRFRCDPSDFVHFRKRIGSEGAEKIFTSSVGLHGEDAQARFVVADSTVQENFTSFPTDAKLAKKVIDGCNRIARAEQIDQRQSYLRVSKQLLRDSYNGHHPRRAAKAKKARRKLRTIAGRLLRELDRKLPESILETYTPLLDLYRAATTQTRTDKHKIYSLHKPFTCCIAKGKAHKKYEFGNKIGLVAHPRNGVILAIQAFQGNPHDSKTIAPLLGQMREYGRAMPQEVIYDRGGTGPKHIDGTVITTPGKPKKSDTAWQRRKTRGKFRRRAAIEPIIGHLKTDHRMGQNYLHGAQSPQINAWLAAAGWNLKKWMQRAPKKIKNAIFRWTYSLDYALSML